MSEIILNKEDCFNALPPEWDDELLQSIRNQIKESLTKIVILDDDPTGTQTIHNLPVLTTWDVDSLKKELKNKSTAIFLKGGRFTIHNVHYVAEGNQLIPAARTSYAQDATFGFSHSNLCQWVEEKTEGRIPADKVIPISLDDLRKGSPKRVKHILMEVPYKSACIVNAVSYKDIEVFVAGLLNARVNGKRFLYRTAASFVQVRIGVAPQGRLLSKTELVSDVSTGGLFVVGSYVPKTTA